MKIKLFFVLIISLVSNIHSFGQWNQNRNTNSLFYNQGNVGFGTSTPAYRMHLWNGTFGINPDSISRIGILFGSGGSDFTNFRHILSNGNDVLFEMNLQPRTSTAAAAYRFFRQTNTTGRKAVDFFRGNNTTQRSAQIGVDGENSFFQEHGGFFGLGTSTPRYLLSAEGVVDTNSSLAYFNATNAGPRASVMTLALRTDDPQSLGMGLRARYLLRGINNGDVVASISQSGQGYFSSLSINGTSFLDNTRISGDDNDGEKAAIRITTEGQILLLDGNEIDGITDGLFLNHNTKQNVYMATGGGKVGIGTNAPKSDLHLNGEFRLQGPTNHTFAMGVNTNGDFEFRRDGGLIPMTITDQSGYVGLGVYTPKDKLHVNGFLRLQSKNEHTYRLGVNETGDLEFRGNGDKVGMVIGDQTGSVGIGFDLPKIPSGYRLAVGGKIICEELRVQLSKEWPDYVFRKGYRLMPLSEVAKSIEANGHLPGIPSAEEVAKNGLTLGEMQAKMMEKIEELTLHMIELSKKNEALEQELRAIKASQK